jgi:hypothetical protein
MSDMIVYTAIFGGRDELVDQVPYPDVQYICFTDDPEMKSDIWDIRVCESHGYPRRDAKIFKILPHRYFPDNDYSLWIDGNYKLIADPKGLLCHLNDHDMACFRHPERDCLYVEAQRCIDWELGKPKVLSRQMEVYRQNGHPEHGGLIYGGVLLRRHNKPEVVRVMEGWHQEIVNHSSRDQVSFPYVARKQGFEWATMEGNSYDSNTQNIVRVTVFHELPRVVRERNRRVEGDKCHIEGDKAYHAGDLHKARELWTEAAALGNEQCAKNLEWIKNA